jgi:COMPASS component SWD3
MNAIGDDHVSFNPMHVTLSPDERYILVSTDRDRLILYTMDTGKLVTNFYGATNDEYSQPRHCWDPSGLYIYSTSQDKTICVWEIKSQSIVVKLEGHGGIVRDLHYCHELNMLVSCGFDGAVKLWRKEN